MLYRWMLVFIIILLSGCSLTKPLAVPVVVKYSLNQVPKSAPVNNPSHKTVLVSWMKSATGYQSSDMLYMTDPYRLQVFAKNSWEAAPAAMLQPLLVDTLRNAHLFRVVLSAPSTVGTEYRLDTTLLKLQQEIFADRVQVRLIMDASLIRNQTNTVIASQRFEVIEPAEANPHSGVVAANKATQRLLEHLVRFTAESMR